MTRAIAAGLLSLALALAPAGTGSRASAQTGGHVARIGILDGGAAGNYSDRHYWQAFREQLARLGYVDGKTVALEYRWANYERGRLPELASELTRLPVEIIVVPSTVVAEVAKRATERIPIVVPLMADPVATGLVASLARPGGNITGLTTLSAELSAKRLELLKEMVPSLSRVAILWDANMRPFELAVKQTEAAAKALGLQLQVLGLRAHDDLDPAFAAMVLEEAQAVIVAVPAGSPRFGENPAATAAMMARHKLPAAYAEREYAQAGGLVSYGPSYPDLFRRAAHYVDKIIKGARPADLPVEEPTRFELVVNLRAAEALGLTVPASILARADAVIE